MLTDVKGVIGADSKLLSELKLKEVNKLIADKIIYGGMIPKVNTCIEAVKRSLNYKNISPNISDKFIKDFYNLLFL